MHRVTKSFLYISTFILIALGALVPTYRAEAVAPYSSSGYCVDQADASISSSSDEGETPLLATITFNAEGFIDCLVDMPKDGPYYLWDSGSVAITYYFDFDGNGSVDFTDTQICSSPTNCSGGGPTPGRYMVSHTFNEVKTHYFSAEMKVQDSGGTYAGRPNAEGSVNVKQGGGNPPPSCSSGPSGFTKCADEGGTCSFSGLADVSYGCNGTFNTQEATNSISCNNATFGDPLPGRVKACFYKTKSPASATIRVNIRNNSNNLISTASYSISPGNINGSGGQASHSVNPPTNGKTYTVTLGNSPGGHSYTRSTTSDGTETTNQSISVTMWPGQTKDVTFYFQANEQEPPAPPPTEEPGESPQANLSVRSTGAAGVAIEQISGGPQGQLSGNTDYTRSYGENYTTRLRAALTAPNGATFSSWSGCDSTQNPRDCIASVSIGATKTVTANYTGSVGACPGTIGSNAFIPCVYNGKNFDTFLYQGSAQPYILAYWNNGGPDNANTDQFSVKWRGSFNLPSGIYRFTLGSDDGSRLYVDGVLLADRWYDQSYSTTNHQINLNAGTHLIEMEYYENSLEATASLSWQKIAELPQMNYSLSNSGNVTVQKGGVTQYGQNTITKTLVSGPAEGVTLSASGLPSGTSVSFTNQGCSPTCTSTATFSVLPSASAGTHPITVTGTPGSRTTQFNLVVNPSPAIVVTCTPVPTSAELGETVTWSANVTGGVPPYVSYSWSGSGVPTNPAPSTNPFSITYSTVGTKTAQVLVTDSASNTGTCSTPGSVQIDFDPQFEEF